MKSTGIVRRIDDLGRIVIPKEIRRTLRIREGDPMEIYTDSSGDIIFKKYSAIKEVSSFAARYAEVLQKKVQLPIIISDCDHIVAVSGAAKREFLERRITPSVEDLMEMRIHYSSLETPGEKFLAIEGLENEALCAFPIISSGDVVGCVSILKDPKTPLTEAEKKSKITLAEITAQFLGKHFED